MTRTLVRKKVRGFGEFHLPSDNILDQSVCKEVLDGSTYPKVASNADIIWDVGANLGAAALYFAKCYPAATIYCFEPSQDAVWNCLEENTRRVSSRIKLCNYGLSNRVEERPMNEWVDSSVTRSCKHQMDDRVVGLPAAFFKTPPSTEGVTIIKIDTEGCELEILDSLDDRNRVPLYYIEYHSESDRRAIDQMLPNHHLVRAQAVSKHRGNLCYLHRSIPTSEDNYEIT